MKVGFIGAGVVTTSIARAMLARGHSVLISSRRGGDSLRDKVAELGQGASMATVAEAASEDVVLLAVPWLQVAAALSGLGSWRGRILIDATNPFVETTPRLVLADLAGRGASEIVAELAMGARVVKAFNSIRMAHFNLGPGHDDLRRALFVSGDDPEAKALVEGLIESIGYAPIDLGGLITGGRSQQAGSELAGRDLFVRLGA